MEWAGVFDVAHTRRGASAGVLEQFVKEVGRPLTAGEVRTINRSQQNPFPPTDPFHAQYRPFDPSLWVIPNGPLPPSYLSFLHWSNGGEFGTGERWFQLFETRQVRDMMLAYHLPQYMPGALPIAFNGGGVFYLLDMRKPAVDGEYRVACASAGNLGWGREECRLVAKSFPAACRGRTNIESLWE